MIIRNIVPFIGDHCETTATGTLLNQLGIYLSEPMLFGIGEGLGFIFWNSKNMDYPFLGGRIKTDLITQNICKNLSLELEVKETSSTNKAWENVRTEINNKRAVGLKLDCYHLEYFSTRFHFAGHYAALYGYDNHYAYLIDTVQQGSQVKTSLESLAKARSERGPMASKKRSYTINKKENVTDLKVAIKEAIWRNAVDYLNPPIRNLSYKGIEKTSQEIKTWFSTSVNRQEEFAIAGLLMERGGTGGALFRNLYSRFLKEAAGALDNNMLYDAHLKFEKIAILWTNVSNLFCEASRTDDEKHIEEASILLRDIAEREKGVMEDLAVPGLVQRDK